MASEVTIVDSSTNRPFGKVSLLADGTITASGAGPAVAVGSWKELLACLNVEAVTTGTLNVFLDSSPDNGVTWFQIATLGALNITAAPTYPVAGYTAALTTFGEQVRVRYTFTGGGSAHFRVDAVGKAA